MASKKPTKPKSSSTTKTKKPMKNTTSNQQSQIAIYKTKSGENQFSVQIDKDTVWLTQKQISDIFDTNVSAINKHIKNILKEGELEHKATISILEIVQKEGNRDVKRKVEIYNLDMIISVGYRVNSNRATQFRIWATKTLREHIVQGYTINEQRLLEYQKNLKELEKTIKLIQNSVDSKQLSSTESKGFLNIITNYTQSFVLLNQFDSDNLNLNNLDKNITYEIKFDEACEAIVELRKQLKKKKEATDLFGNQKDQSFSGILGNITQSFGGEYLYKTIEEQAAHLLYFVIKNHPFSDGNKRIGAFIIHLVSRKKQTSFQKKWRSKN